MSTLGRSRRTAIAAAAFDRATERCSAADDERYVLALAKLRTVVESITELARVIRDIEAEGRAWRERNARAEADLRTELVEFRKGLTKEFPQLRASATMSPPTQVDPGQMFEYEQSLARFDKIATQLVVKSPSLMPERFENQSAAATMHHILSYVVSKLSGEDNQLGERVAEIHRGIRDFGNRVEWLHRERVNYLRSSPFMAWLEVGQRADDLNPEPQPEPKTLDLNELLGEAIDGRFAIPFVKVAYGMGSNYGNLAPSKGEVEAFRAWRADMEHRLTLLRDEVLLRLDLREAVDSYVARYAARCMWYRRDQLAQAVATCRKRGSRNVERMLAADAAAYLFDQGFSVVTELSLGVSRLDVLGLARDRPVLVEAKAYEDSGKTAVVSGLRQLQDYGSRLEAGFAQPENYLLVFRLGGQRLAPPPEVELAGRSYRIVQIDLASARESGSRALAPLPLGAEDLAREVLGMDPPKKRHRRRPNVTRAHPRKRSKTQVGRQTATPGGKGKARHGSL